MGRSDAGWELEYTDVFGEWWERLSSAEQVDVAAVVDLLVRRGPSLAYPFSSKVVSSRHGQLRELRIQHAGRPYRVLYAFDHRRVGILLLGGDKTGDDRWYDVAVPKADTLFAQHLTKFPRGA